MNLFLLHTPGSHLAAAAPRRTDVDKNRGLTARNDGAPPGAPVS
jgi:hypothetical protein